jgi:hypothetical protein
MDVSEVKILARRANGILFVAPVFILLSGFCLVYSILVLSDIIEPDKDILWVIYLFTFSGGRRHYSSFGYYRKIERFNRAWDMEYVYNMGASESELFGIYTISLDAILWHCIVCHGFCFLIFLLLFLDRLSTPKTIMEYDDFGVYIYRTGKPVTLLRYEELWSTYAEEDFENVEFCYHRGFHTSRNIKISDPFWGILKTGSIRIETPDDFICLGGIYHVKEVEKEIKRMVRKNRREFLDEMYDGIEKSQRQRELEELTKHNPET